MNRLSILAVASGLALSVSAVAGPGAENVLYVATPPDPFRGMEDGMSWATAFTDLQDAIDVTIDDPFTSYEIRVAQGDYRPSRAPTGLFDVIPVDLTGVGGAIPDAVENNEVPGVFTSTIDVETLGTVTGLELDVELMHTWSGDIRMTLTSPNGTELSLVRNVGATNPASAGDSSDWGGTYTFSDDGGDVWAAAAAGGGTDLIAPGDYMARDNDYAGGAPVVDLSGFDGEMATGTWTLRVEDWFTADTGAVSGWSLRFDLTTGGARGEVDPIEEPREFTFEMRPNVRMLGGFAGPFGEEMGKGIDPDTRDPMVFSTVLNGRLPVLPEKRGGPTNSVYHVVDGSVADESSLLDGFVITNGVADGVGADAGGGGVYVGDEGDARINECLIFQNEGEFGAGLYVGQSARATISNSIIASNASNQAGGGVYSEGDLEVVSTRVVENEASEGAGLFVWGDTLIMNGLIHDNIAEFAAGGVVTFGGDVRIVNSTIVGNACLGLGGGVLHNGGAVSIDNSIVYDNADAFGQGYGAQISGAPLERLQYCLVEGYATPVSGLGAEEGTFDGNPVFADPDSGDYRIATGSDAIDAGRNDLVASDVADLDSDGDTDEQTPFDFAGNQRIDTYVEEDRGIDPPADIVDIGAYEYDGVDPIIDFDCPGDANGDGEVNFDDLNLLLEFWNEDVPAGTNGDVTGNGVVNFDDLNLLLEFWGESCEEEMPA